MSVIPIIYCAIVFGLAGLQICAGQTTQSTSVDASKEEIAALPSLKGATGKRKDQLLALISLDTQKPNDDQQRQKVARLFTLSDKSDSALLEELLSGSENAEIQPRLSVLFALLGQESVEWLSSRYETASPTMKARVLGRLHFLEFKEAYELLSEALKDQTAVPNKKGKALAPPGYVDERICDYGYNELVWKIKRAGGALPPPLTSAAISPLNPIEQRDRQISALQAYISDVKSIEWSRFLAGRPSARN